MRSDTLLIVILATIAVVIMGIYLTLEVLARRKFLKYLKPGDTVYYFDGDTMVEGQVRQVRKKKIVVEDESGAYAIRKSEILKNKLSWKRN